MSDANEIEIPSEDDVETPTLADVLQELKETTKFEMRVCSPAKILKYYKDTQTVDVQPVFKNKYLDGRIEDPPPIFNVPVMFHRGGKGFMSMPIKEGDSVTLVFSDRSLEKWQTSGALDHPGETRTHHISDAMAIPGGYPLNNNAKIDNSDDVILGNDKIEARFKPNGHLQILNGEELIKAISDFMIATISGDLGGMYSAWDRLNTFLEQ